MVKCRVISVPAASTVVSSRRYQGASRRGPGPRTAPRRETGSEQDAVLGENGRDPRTRGPGDSSPPGPPRPGIRIRRVRRARPGQPVAAGDRQISDVAVMPLMKLTQHSLPTRGPPGGLMLCVYHGKHSRPQPHHVSTQCASDLTAPPMHRCIVYSLVCRGGKA